MIIYRFILRLLLFMMSLHIIFYKGLDIITLITILLKRPKYVNDSIFNVSKYVL